MLFLNTMNFGKKKRPQEAALFADEMFIALQLRSLRRYQPDQVQRVVPCTPETLSPKLDSPRMHSEYEAGYLVRGIESSGSKSFVWIKLLWDASIG